MGAILAGDAMRRFILFWLGGIPVEDCADMMKEKNQIIENLMVKARADFQQENEKLSFAYWAGVEKQASIQTGNHPTLN